MTTIELFQAVPGGLMHFIDWVWGWVGGFATLPGLVLVSWIALFVAKRCARNQAAGLPAFSYETKFKLCCIPLVFVFAYFDQPWLAHGVLLFIGGQWAWLILGFVVLSIFGPRRGRYW